MLRKWLLVAVAALAAGSGAWAQVNNQALEFRRPVKPGQAGELQLGLNAFGYQKNNEYFNDIAEGYTLFGYHLNPRLIYFPTDKVRIDAGAQVQKDFGTRSYSLVQPTFTIRYEENGMALLFGTLEGNVNHGYIEPLYDFERVITNRLENGLQFLLDKPGAKLDVWIDWQRYIRRLDPFQEEVAGGASAELTLYRTPVSMDFPENKPQTETYIGVPLQFTAQHRGGQIDDTQLPLVTLSNVAAGLVIRKTYNRNVLKALHFQPYVVGWKDFSNTKAQPFTQGGGLYLNAGIDTKYQNVMLSYWRGSGYYSELGGRLFPSVSSNFKTPGYTQKNRQVLILRFLHDLELTQGLSLTLRLEPYLDLDFPKLEFSNSLHLNFNSDFFLTRLKKR
ncbi:hypothetical protein ACD591_11675 [Rufibacter glacialis]|uniref:Uncharacterized protein n=1 Tax=Rufibacter glacialis TaxID=1259555 RepID=A0ABV4RI68_9BACT|nr:hypothetical protein [Rufibacter glacialis]GGK59844.1 hypothetical protein GCM10011405_04980 [Rufibacter glacialis]